MLWRPFLESATKARRRSIFFGRASLEARSSFARADNVTRSSPWRLRTSRRSAPSSSWIQGGRLVRLSLAAGNKTTHLHKLRHIFIRNTSIKFRRRLVLDLHHQVPMQARP